jgi:hypothetical protein
MLKSVAFSILTLAALSATAASAAEQKYSKCTVGDRVVDRKGQTGTVTKVQSDGIYCYVDIDNGPKNDYFIYWMLKPAGGNPAAYDAAMTGVKPGRYECWMRAGGSLNYMFMDVNIRDASNYTDKKGVAGTYSFDAASKVITFKSGPQAGSYSKLMEPGKIGISSQQTTMFNVVCNLKG